MPKLIKHRRESGNPGKISFSSIAFDLKGVVNSNFRSFSFELKKLDFFK